MPLLLGHVERQGKASKWEPWHRGEKPKSQHQRQMSVGENLHQEIQGMPMLGNHLVC
jgi:hypothetical protein